MGKIKEPKDLGIKIGTKVEVFWTKVKDNVEAQILENEQSLFILRNNLQLANEKIAEEEKKP